MDIQRPKINVKTNPRVAPVTSDVTAKQPKVEAETFHPETEPERAPVATKEPKQKKGGAWKMWLLGVVIVLLAAGGVYAWQQQSLGSQVSELNDQLSSVKSARDTAQKQAEQAAADLKTAQDTAAANTAAANTAASTASADFLTISELGFKFKPGADLKDLVYFVNGSDVYFSTRSLMAAAYKAHNDHADMACTPNLKPLGIVSKSTKTSTGSVKVGSFFVTRTPQTSACSDDKTTTDLETKQATALGEALKSAVAN